MKNEINTIRKLFKFLEECKQEWEINSSYESVIYAEKMNSAIEYLKQWFIKEINEGRYLTCYKCERKEEIKKELGIIKKVTNE